MIGMSVYATAPFGIDRAMQSVCSLKVKFLTNLVSHWSRVKRIYGRVVAQRYREAVRTYSSNPLPRSSHAGQVPHPYPHVCAVVWSPI
ncbi:hypothetical protein CBM2586_A10267 [Cupriavidus phytorum]|uniref:Uncharacterized protein n=1 Tax=Cupriavidus taiwanensis TaxID=164546 RepID=A0A375B9D8_9BURK|nr:hypothetical protein CBM2586_A10267 [Cupriavidus taiwanensis]